MIRRVLVAGGGTGGHLFPGIAVVEELERRIANLEVLFVGTERGIEARVLPKLGRNVQFIEVSALKGKSLAGLAKSVGVLPKAGLQSLKICREFKPDLVIGVGGYASGPVLAAASSLGIATAILEQNAHVGLTNRMLASFVGRAFISYEETRAVFGEKRARLVGNPVRRAFVEAAKLVQADPEGFSARRRRVLVLGGSQGSKSMNTLVPQALAQAGVASLGFEVVHQTGDAMVQDVRAQYDSLGIAATVVPFIDDMARAYASASLVVSRAGATTLAELCTMGRASALIPFPHAADDHQRRNAEALQARGAAVCLPEPTLTVDALAQTLSELLRDDARRNGMARAAQAASAPEAAALIVDELIDWLGVDADSKITGGGSPADAKRTAASSSSIALVPELLREREALASSSVHARKRHPRVRGLRVSSTRPLAMRGTG